MNSRNVESQLLPLLPSLPILLLLLRVYFGEGLPLEGFLGGRTSWGGEEEGLQGGQVFGRDKLVLPFEEAEEVVAAGKAVLGAAVKEHLLIGTTTGNPWSTLTTWAVLSSSPFSSPECRCWLRTVLTLLVNGVLA